MRVALVHDDLIQFGGAEKLLLTMSKLYPAAPIYTSIYNRQLAKVDKRFEKIDIRTSWMQKLPFKTKLRRAYFPLYPGAFESFDFSEFDVVLSSSTRFAHGVITKPRTLHICYSNSPTRFLWETRKYLEYENLPKFVKTGLLPMLSILRIWDQMAAKRPDFWIANSKNVAAKLKKYYKVDSTVIYPFVDLEKFTQNSSRRQSLSASQRRSQNYFLVVSRLLAWKRIEIAIKAVNYLKCKLKIVGTGPAYKNLKRLAKNNVEFLGEVQDSDLVKLYFGCLALILPQEEDFGINVLEAQAAGKPVIAYGVGGAVETVVSGKTGVFFEEQTEDSLIGGIKKLKGLGIKSDDCRRNAEKFSKENFQKNLKKFVEVKWREFYKTTI